MNVIAIDCTRKSLTLAVKNDGKWFSCFCEDGNSHSVNMNLMIDGLLKDAGLGIDGIDVFCCNVGPGSFTGIRIAVATIKGLNFGRKKKLAVVNTFELLAYNVSEAVNVFIPDNKGYFFARMENGIPVTVPEHITFEEKKSVGKLREIIFTEGDYSEALKAVCDRKIENGCFCEDFDPLYIRKSQAEELYGNG